MHLRRATRIALLTSCVLATVCDARAQVPAVDPPEEAPPAAPSEDPPLAAPAPPAAVVTGEPAATPRMTARPLRFGDPGEVVVTGAASIGIASTTYDLSEASSFAVAFSPGFDVFARRGLSVGADVDVGYEARKGYASDGALVTTKDTTLAFGSRIGLNVAFGEHVSWYPRLTLGLTWLNRDTSNRARSVTTTSVSRSSAFVSIFAPLLLHPQPHVFFGVGPVVFHELGDLQHTAGDLGQRTSIAGRFVLGAWWGGRATEEEAIATDPPATTPAPRFGERGQWVFTGEVGGAASWTAYEDDDTTTTFASLTPGFDYFVTRRFSLGVALSAYYRRDVDRGTTASDTAFGGGPRFGGDVPLSSWLSLYPRATVSVLRETTGDTRGRNGALTVISTGIYTPLLLHVAPHAFVGFGPFVSRDLARTTSRGASDKYATRVGAALVVGAWL